MVRRRNEFPTEGELIIGTVKEVNPNSVFVVLDEYDKEGMIHISEIAKKWVRDIRDWVTVGKKIVCKVKDVRREKGQIDLSLKDVSDRGRNRRMQDWKRDERGEEFLKELADRDDISLEEAYEKIGFDLQDNFKDMLKPFELAVGKGKNELTKRGLKEEWSQKIKNVGEDKIKRKEKELSERFTLRIRESDGVEVLKKVLGEVKKEEGVEFKYISAPQYEIIKRARNLKDAEKSIGESIGAIEDKLEGNDFELHRSHD